MPTTFRSKSLRADRTITASAIKLSTRIKIDNTGDAVEDLVYQFRFSNQRRSGDTFLYNTGAMAGPNDKVNRNVTQTYTVTRVALANGVATGSTDLGLLRDGVPGILAPLRTVAMMAPTRPTPRSSSAISAGGGGKVFVGPRDEGFYLDINAIFDLLNIQPH